MAENTNYYQVLDLAGVQQLWNTCKATFVRTVNGQGIDANGNVQINVAGDFQVNGSSVVVNGVANINTQSAYNASTNKIATMADVPTKALDSWTRILTSSHTYVEYSRFLGSNYIIHVHCNAQLISSIGEELTAAVASYSFLIPNETRRAIIAGDYSNASGRISVGLDLGANGRINCYPHIHNQMSGSVALALYGDAYFII